MWCHAVGAESEWTNKTTKSIKGVLGPAQQIIQQLSQVGAGATIKAFPTSRTDLMALLVDDKRGPSSKLMNENYA